jgi:hypothetical protein
MPLNRRDLRRLVLERVQPVQVARDDLDRATTRTIPIAIANIVRAAGSVASPRRCQGPTAPTTSPSSGGQHHVHQTVRKRGLKIAAHESAGTNCPA